MSVAQQRQQAYQQLAASVQRQAAQQQAENAQIMQTYLQNTRPPAPASSTTTCTALGSNTVTCNTNGL